MFMTKKNIILALLKFKKYITKNSDSTNIVHHGDTLFLSQAVSKAQYEYIFLASS